MPIFKNKCPKDGLPETKKWQACFLEFLLIFLAFALGFFAESIREDLGDQEKEREFF